MRNPALVTSSLLALLLALQGTPTAHAQDVGDMRVFGSMQSLFMHQYSYSEINIPEARLSLQEKESRNSFAIQQLDFFFDKPIDDAFNAFVDLEFQLNYSSEKRWGSLSIQEAWLNYSYNDAVNLKVGLLFPAFNQYNEVKNRLAVLPFIFRPMVYERLLAQRFLTEDFIPEHAYVQFSGWIPTRNLMLDYAVYVGNSEASYITRNHPDGGIDTDLNPNFEFLSGVDPTDINLKLFGARIGLRSPGERFRGGLSFTRDANNMRERFGAQKPYFSEEAIRLMPDDAERYRFGLDLSHKHGDFLIEGEIIKVVYDLGKAERKLDLSLEQSFVYTLVGYELHERLFSFVSAQWGDYSFGLDADYFTGTAGIAWKWRDDITAKAQWVMYTERMENLVNDDGVRYGQNTRLHFILLGLSVLL